MAMQSPHGPGRAPWARLRRLRGPALAGRSPAAGAVGVRGLARTTVRFLAPRWLAVHVVVLAAVIAMILLGRWQLRVSDAKHFDLQNFSYVIQWWAFAAFALLLWARLIRDALHPPDAEQGSGSSEIALRTGPGSGLGVAYLGPADLVAAPDGSGRAPAVYRGYVIPNSAQSLHRSRGDDYHESYNDYLWQLSLADAAADAEPVRVEAEPATSSTQSGERIIDAAPQDGTAHSG